MTTLLVTALTKPALRCARGSVWKINCIDSVTLPFFLKGRVLPYASMRGMRAKSCAKSALPASWLLW